MNDKGTEVSMIEKQTKAETRWHDRDLKTEILVPAGEPVQVLEYRDVPVEHGRSHLRSCIEANQKRGRQCVPIKIRGWYALIDADQLEFPEVGGRR